MKVQLEKKRNLILICQECSQGWGSPSSMPMSHSTWLALELQKRLSKDFGFGKMKVLTTCCQSLCPQGAITVDVTRVIDEPPKSLPYSFAMGDNIDDFYSLVKTYLNSQ